MIIYRTPCAKLRWGDFPRGVRANDVSKRDSGTKWTHGLGQNAAGSDSAAPHASRASALLRQNRPDHVRFFDAGEAGVEAAEAMGEPRVIDPETVQNRRVQIAQVHRILAP